MRRTNQKTNGFTDDMDNNFKTIEHLWKSSYTIKNSPETSKVRKKLLVGDTAKHKNKAKGNLLCSLVNRYANSSWDKKWELNFNEINTGKQEIDIETEATFTLNNDNMTKAPVKWDVQYDNRNFIRSQINNYGVKGLYLTALPKDKWEVAYDNKNYVRSMLTQPLHIDHKRKTNSCSLYNGTASNSGGLVHKYYDGTRNEIHGTDKYHHSVPRCNIHSIHDGDGVHSIHLDDAPCRVSDKDDHLSERCLEFRTYCNRCRPSAVITSKELSNVGDVNQKSMCRYLHPNSDWNKPNLECHHGKCGTVDKKAIDYHPLERYQSASMQEEKKRPFIQNIRNIFSFSMFSSPTKNIRSDGKGSVSKVINSRSMDFDKITYPSEIQVQSDYSFSLSDGDQHYQKSINNRGDIHETIDHSVTSVGTDDIFHDVRVASNSSDDDEEFHSALDTFPSLDICEDFRSSLSSEHPDKTKSSSKKHDFDRLTNEEIENIENEIFEHKKMVEAGNLKNFRRSTRLPFADDAIRLEGRPTEVIEEKLYVSKWPKNNHNRNKIE